MFLSRSRRLKQYAGMHMKEPHYNYHATVGEEPSQISNSPALETRRGAPAAHSREAVLRPVVACL